MSVNAFKELLMNCKEFITDVPSVGTVQLNIFMFYRFIWYQQLAQVSYSIVPRPGLKVATTESLV